MENYLYFAESSIDGGGVVTGCDPDAVLLPARNYLDVLNGSGSLAFRFRDHYSVDDAIPTATGGNDLGHHTTVTLTVDDNDKLEVLQAFADIMMAFTHSTGLQIVADADTEGTTKTAEFHKLFNGKVTGCTIDNSRSCS